MLANQYRSDLQAAGFGDGRHGFYIPTPLSLRNGAAHTVTVRYAGTFTGLNNSPRTISCAAYTPSYLGYFDYADCSVLSGWAWDANQPNTPIMVDVYADNNLTLSVVANYYRPDVQAAGFGDGRHGFQIPLPASLRDGQPHSIKIKYGSSQSELYYSPRTINCTATDFTAARLDQHNRTGAPGEDLFSGNFNWSLPILGRPGRAGLDLSLALTYNSLVWTKSGSVMNFDADRGYPAPGFRLGYPVIEPMHYNSSTGLNGYLMIMPSGQRVELRQVGYSNTFEAADSSYLQLVADFYTDVLTVRTTDGTQLKYVSSADRYRCTEVKDRNGNFLTITYKNWGGIDTITDTLGRRFLFSYDSYYHLQTIERQVSPTEFEVEVTFGYYPNTYLDPKFATTLSIQGVNLSSPVPLLKQVGLADGSRYNFEYTRYGQVNTIRRYAPNQAPPANENDYFQRAYTTYNLPNDTTAQSDCPRFTTRTDWAYEWNNGVTSTFSLDSAGAWGQVTTPDGTIYREYFATTGWQRGLTTQAEFYSSDAPPPNSAPKKKTVITWTQDNTGVSYFCNPRATETNVYDEIGNRRRTTVEYTSYGLPRDVYEYDKPPNTQAVLRRTHTDYNLGAIYTDRRLISLPSARCVYDGNGYVYSGGAYNNPSEALVSKVTYLYDEGGECLQNQGAAVQHDVAYDVTSGTGYVQARGNLTSARRWDVYSQADQTKSVVYKTGYNTSGSAIFTREPNPLPDDPTIVHQTDISYLDSFSDGVNRNTFAYPTKVTDPDGRVAATPFYSTTQYDYLRGWVTRTETPKRWQDPSGIITTYAYDVAGRITQVTNGINGAYTRYVYQPNQYYVVSYTTLNDLASEYYAVTVFGGADRVRAVASDHPTASDPVHCTPQDQSGCAYKAQYNGYDALGRLGVQSNPTQINPSWYPAGDDAAGWVWSYQAYDWKGRPTVFKHPDDTDQNPDRQQLSYGGCGCAGGEVMTLTDEVGRR